MRRGRLRTYRTADLARKLRVSRWTAWRIMKRSGIGYQIPGTNRWETNDSRIMSVYPDLIAQLVGD